MALLASVGAQLSKATRGTCPGTGSVAVPQGSSPGPQPCSTWELCCYSWGFTGVLGVHRTPKTV